MWDQEKKFFSLTMSSFDQSNIHVPYGMSSWKNQMTAIFQKYGVCVITGVYSDLECSTAMDSVVSAFEALGTGISRKDPETWIPYRTPVQTRPGLYQNLMGHLPEIWKARTSPRVKEIFSTLYSAARGKIITDFVCSIDGLNILPNGSKHLSHNQHLNSEGQLMNENNPNDWPHLDQTDSSNIFKCIQGQLVLTNTTAGFVCSPGSHLALKEILQLWQRDGESSNWLKINFSYPPFNETIKLVKSKGGYWQIPIIVPKGSFIVWSSALIHSAKLPDRIEPLTANDPWLGWRGVFYISYRPKHEFSKSQYEKIIKCIRENRIMNHWNLEVFPKLPGGRHTKSTDRDPILKNYIEDPTLIYKKLGINPEILIQQLQSL